MELTPLPPHFFRTRYKILTEEKKKEMFSEMKYEIEDIDILGYPPPPSEIGLFTKQIWRDTNLADLTLQGILLI